MCAWQFLILVHDYRQTVSNKTTKRPWSRFNSKELARIIGGTIGFPPKLTGMCFVTLLDMHFVKFSQGSLRKFGNRMFLSSADKYGIPIALGLKPFCFSVAHILQVETD
jgi:hypothetical protein